jgi:hypothetical protein
MLLTQLRDYQQTGVDKAEPHDGFVITAEQRTGKCLMALALVDQRKPFRLLIVCPLGAIAVWEAQIKEHIKFDPPCETSIVNFEEFQRRRKKYQKWIINASSSTMMIVDEAHRIKKRGSKQSRACRTVGKYATWRLALTGTPLSKKKSIEDVWTIFNFIDPEIFGRYSDKLDHRTGEVLELGFESTYLIKGGFKGKKVVGYKNKKEFYDIFHKYTYRITLREARKKPLLIRRKKIWVEMSPETRKPYNELERKLETTIGTRSGGRRKKIKIPHIMNLSMKQQQMTGGWVFPEREEGERQPKPIRMGFEKEIYLRLLLKSIPLEKKIVICARFSHEVAAIARLVERVRGTVKIIQGGSKYDGKFDVDVIVLQIQSAISIDLSAAKIIILYSWDHSYINHEQMRFRILSYDTKQITYYYLIMRNSVDEELYQAIVLKKKLADLVCDRVRRRRDRERQIISKATGASKRGASKTSSSLL